MYCKACGKKIAPGIESCPHCGRRVDLMSGGTGFWDIREGGRQTAAALPDPPREPIADDVGADAKTKTAIGKTDRKRGGTWIRNILRAIVGLLILALLVVNILVLVKVRGLSGKTAALEAQQREIAERLSAIEEQAQDDSASSPDARDGAVGNDPTAPPTVPSQTPDAPTADPAPTDGTSSSLDLRIESAARNEAGVYLISQDTEAVWEDVGAEAYRLTIVKPDGDYLKGPYDEVYHDVDVSGKTKQRILLDRMEDSGEYRMEIKAIAGDAVIESQEIRFKIAGNTASSHAL